MGRILPLCCFVRAGLGLGLRRQIQPVRVPARPGGRGRRRSVYQVCKFIGSVQLNAQCLYQSPCMCTHTHAVLFPGARLSPCPTLTACPKPSPSPQSPLVQPKGPPGAPWGLSPGSASQPHRSLTLAVAPTVAGPRALGDPNEDTFHLRQDSKGRPSWKQRSPG